ncbi:MAG: MAPEG family protein [Pseudomonadota bacterium]
MNQTAIFWPMLLQVALIYAVYVLMSYRRKAAIRAGSARTSDFRENRNEPPESLFVRNNLANQFELPVLFFVVCLALYDTNGSNVLTVALAWVFVISRYAHAAIHVTTNRIRHRQPLFVAGFLALFAMWVWFALHIAGIV